MATLTSKRPEPDFIEHPDVDCLYRMVSLACASLTCGQGADHQRVMAVAEAFFEFIDPLSADNIDPRHLPGALR